MSNSSKNLVHLARIAVVTAGIAMMTACNTSTAPKVSDVTPSINFTPSTPQENDALASMMESAKAELSDHLYRIDSRTLGIKNPEEMTPFALQLAQYAQDTVAQKTATGQFALSEDLFLDPTLQNRMSISYGRWQYGIWINFTFSSAEARSVIWVTNTIANNFQLYARIPYATAYFLASRIVSASFTWCNRYGTGVVVDAGTTAYVVPYIYCRPR